MLFKMPLDSNIYREIIIDSLPISLCMGVPIADYSRITFNKYNWSRALLPYCHYLDQGFLLLFQHGPFFATNITLIYGMGKNNISGL